MRSSTPAAPAATAKATTVTPSASSTPPPEPPSQGKRKAVYASQEPHREYPHLDIIYADDGDSSKAAQTRTNESGVAVLPGGGFVDKHANATCITLTMEYEQCEEDAHPHHKPRRMSFVGFREDLSGGAARRLDGRLTPQRCRGEDIEQTSEKRGALPHGGFLDKSVNDRIHGVDARKRAAGRACAGAAETERRSIQRKWSAPPTMPPLSTISTQHAARAGDEDDTPANGDAGGGRMRRERRGWWRAKIPTTKRVERGVSVEAPSVISPMKRGRTEERWVEKTRSKRRQGRQKGTEGDRAVRGSSPGIISTHIAATKDDARPDMERVVARGGTCIFTDGSGFEDGAGAAAVAVTGRREGTRRQKLLGSMVSLSTSLRTSLASRMWTFFWTVNPPSSLIPPPNHNPANTSLLPSTPSSAAFSVPAAPSASVSDGFPRM
ncbi:hypothetical protein R3P38DRAFT_3485478 [Favolaschia claudopus]|uniref:Uncharacterized protein n=1 Tax=Favolaschia claudopus TaxID=2862362 RepID=A0AAV9Z730_9AGAR